MLFAFMQLHHHAFELDGGASGDLLGDIQTDFGRIGRDLKPVKFHA